MTHEREITSMVDLCTVDGRRLNPAARGWSRHPFHRANLRGGWGRTKRWDYWAILAGDLVVSFLYADIDYLGLAEVWWVDLATGRTGGGGVTRPLGIGMTLPDSPGSVPLRIDRPGFSLEIRDDSDLFTHVAASWTEQDGAPGRLSASIATPPGHESLNVVIPWSDRRFQYTLKDQARPATGELHIGDTTRWFGGDHDDAWGVLDVGRGRWPYSTRWNWGGGAGRVGPGGPVVGLQLGGKWTAGTGFTENSVTLDGRLTKIGDELVWDYDWNDPMRAWRVTDPGGRLDLVLTPRYDKHSRTSALLLATETHQIFGTWSGTVIPDDHDPILFEGLLGFAEESRSRW